MPIYFALFCPAFSISDTLFACCALVTVRHDASTCILNTTSSTQGLIGLTDRHRQILTDRYPLGFPGRTRHMENQRHWWSVPLLDPTWSYIFLLLIPCLPACKRRRTNWWLFASKISIRSLAGAVVTFRRCIKDGESMELHEIMVDLLPGFDPGSSRKSLTRGEDEVPKRDP